MWWHCLDSTWIVKANLTPTGLRDGIAQYVDANDEIFVVDITSRQAAWQGFKSDCQTWLANGF